jgi:hypothetical protein
MDRSISQEKQTIKRPKLGKSDFNSGINMGENGTEGMVLNDSAELNKSDMSSEYEVDNEKVYALQQNLEFVNDELQEIYKDMIIMRAQNNERELQYDLLAQAMVKKDKDFTTLKNRILELEKRGMNRNLRINNLDERPRENAELAVNAYLEGKIQNTSYDIEVAHRNGPKLDGDDSRTRPMIVQLKSRGMVEKILKATKSDGEFSRQAVRVTRQVPTELRHVTAKIHHLAEIAKKIYPGAKVEVKDKAIYVNNQRRKPPLAPPTLERTLTSDPNELDILKNINFFASDLI